MTLKAYWEKYHTYIILIGLFAFLLHGVKLQSPIIGIDTEDLIHLQKDFYDGWLNTGRHGLVLWKQFTGTLCFQPYFAGVLTILLLAAAVAAFVLLWGSVAGRRHWSLLIGAFLWMSHPILTEQLYFSLQSVEICAGILMTAIALYGSKRFAEKKKWFYFVGSVLLLLITFSMYQVFVPFYIFGTVSILFLQSVCELDAPADKGQKDRVWKLLWRKTFPYVAVFLTAFIGNTLITNVFFAKSEYLERQVLWGSVPVMDNIRAIAAHVGKTLIGYDGVYYHFSYGVLVLLAIIMGAAYILSRKNKGRRLVSMFYLISLLIAPYLLVLVCGGGTVIRSQLILPAATGFLVYVDWLLLARLRKRYLLAHKGQEETQETAKASAKGRSIGGLVGLFAACLLLFVAVVSGAWKQSYNTMALYYTEQCRYAQDEALGRQLILEIDKVRGEEDYPVAVIGSKAFSPNNTNVLGETIGKSFFDYDAEVEPMYFWSTKRILGFLHTLGREYPQIGLEQMETAHIYSEDMPQWPAQGSVQVIDGMVIVKLNVE